MISLVISIVWFRTGLTLGGGDDGIFFTYPNKIFQNSLSLWFESPGPGNSVFNATFAVPLFAILTILQKIGLANYLIQAILFFSIFFSAQVGVYYFFRLIWPDYKLAAFSAALFYLLNTFALVQIWFHGFVAIYFFFALFPITLALYTAAVIKRNLIYALLVPLPGLIYSIAYSHPAFIVLMWLAIFLLSVLFLFWGIPFRTITKSFLTALLSFLFLNAFWLIPFIYVLFVVNPIPSRVFFQNLNELTLLSLAQYSTLPYLLSFNYANLSADHIQILDVFIKSPFGFFYQNLLVKDLLWLPFLLAILALLNFFKDKRVWPVIILVLIGILLAKGAAAPGQDLVVDLFNRFPYLYIFRNPYQKAGLLYVFFFSGLVGLGIQTIFGYLYHFKIVQLITVAAIFVILIGLAWPIWTGKVWEKLGQTYVEIPTEYQKVRQIVNSTPQIGSIIGLPITSQDLLFLNWPRRYLGSDPSPLLFDAPVISGFTVNPYTSLLTDELAINQGIIPLDKLAILLGANHLLFHHDYLLDAKAMGGHPIKNLDKVWQRPKEGQIFCCNEKSGPYLFKNQGGYNAPVDQLTQDYDLATNEKVQVYNYVEWTIFGLKYIFPPDFSTQDWTKDDVLEVNLKTNLPVNLSVKLVDQNGKQLHFGNLNFEKDVWTKQYLHLKQAAKPLGEPDLKSLKEVWIVAEYLPRIQLSIEARDLAIHRTTAVEQASIKPLFQGELLSLYGIDNPAFAGLFSTYTQTKTIKSVSEITVLLPQTDVENVVFVPENFPVETLKGDSPPQVSVQRKGKTRFEILAEKSPSPYLLNFAQSFDPGWVAKSNGKILPHYLLNGYANGWYVDKSDRLTKIEVYYQPDRVTPYAILISLLGGLIMFYGVILDFKKRKNAEVPK